MGRNCDALGITCIRKQSSGQFKDAGNTSIIAERVMPSGGSIAPKSGFIGTLEEFYKAKKRDK